MMARELSPELQEQVKSAIDAVKKLATDGVTRSVLERMTQELERLGRMKHLFPRALFPPPDGPTNILYQIASDPDGQYALYVSVANRGKETPPHNHATWAAIVGIEGEERNKLYRRKDDRRSLDAVQLELVGEHVVKPGEPICLMPDDIHSIHVESDEPALHLHLYGRRLEDLRARLQFDLVTGKAKHFPPNPNIR
jgi:predicted metal-dependent enzyme (double-stranded beta helix superfamily)